VTHVDFYILGGESEDVRLKFACKVADQAMQQSRHVFVNATSDTEARQLDELLWTFIQGSFIPHRVVRDGDADVEPREPVLIGLRRAPPSGRWDLMINLAADVPDYFSRYERVAELVDGNATRREQSRERYRFYRDRGYSLNTHQV
jgi:DNA polymerase-3 subunit chi